MPPKDSFRGMTDLSQRLTGRLPAPLRERLHGLPPGRSALVGVLVVLLIVALISGGEEEPAPDRPSAAPVVADQQEPRVPRGVGQAMDGMALEDKVAQLFLFGFEGTDKDAEIFSRMRKMDLGGLVATSRNYGSRGQLEGLTDEAAAVAKRAKHVPPWIMARQTGGEFSAFGDLPPELPPAETESPAAAAKAASEAAKALLSIGVNGVLGPPLDVAPEEGGSLEGQAYSDLPEEVTEYSRATVEAYDRAELFAAAEHFPGLGGASLSPEVGPASVGLTLEELEQRDLRPFRAAIDSGVPGMVVGNGVYASDDFLTPASISPSVVTGLLRDELGFDGVAIADDLSQPGVTATIPVPEAAVEAIKAGEDMVYIDGREADQRDAYDAVLSAVEKDEIPMARIDEALIRVLTAKRDAGLLE